MPAEILEFKPRPKIEVAHGFLIENAIDVCNTRSHTSALETIAGDLRFQGGELMKIPISDEFTYIHKTELEKLIFECDTEIQSDLLEVTSKTTRNGKEYPAVAGWRDLLLARNNALKAKKNPQKKGETIIQINPPQDTNDTSDKCNYVLGQANIAYIDGSDKIRVFQAQFGGNTDTCARLFKILTQNPDFDPQDIKSVDQMMMSFGVVDDKIDQEQVLRALTFVTGKTLPSHAELMRQKEEMSYNAKLGALKFYNAVKLGLPVAELTKLYAKLLGETLPKTVINEMKTTLGWSGGLMAMETNCGLVSFGEELNPNPLAFMTVKREKWGYSIGDCVRSGCSEKNVKVGPCNICQKCEQDLARKPLPMAA